MGTKYCIWCGVEWKYKGTQEHIGSVCKECKLRSSKIRERAEAKQEPFILRRRYTTTILNYPHIRKFLKDCTVLERAKINEFLKLASKVRNMKIRELRGLIGKSEKN